MKLMKATSLLLILFLLSGELLANGDQELRKRFVSFKIYLQKEMHPLLTIGKSFNPAQIQEILINANQEHLITEELIQFIPAFANEFIQSNDLISLQILAAMNFQNAQDKKRALDLFCIGVPFIFLQVEHPTTPDTFFDSVTSYINTFWGHEIISSQIKGIYKLLPIAALNQQVLPSAHNESSYTEAATPNPVPIFFPASTK